jgi:uncharacterized protein CbrC (UPF0167 family)
MHFEYFAGPIDEMSGLSAYERTCSLCGAQSLCFDLQFAICPELPEVKKESAVGCPACLRLGRFEFWHDTEIGLLDEVGLTHVYKHNKKPPAGFPEAALVALRRTPQFASWQQGIWLAHCDDFMRYIGTWEPPDFYRMAKDGDGRKLFLEMTDDYPNLWNESLSSEGERLTSWHVTYYVFQCRHCWKLRGNWDCD